jgi:hypothetical protein
MNKNLNKFLFLLSSFGFLSACSHSIDLRSAHFLTPTVSENQWDGSIALSGAKPTKVTLIDDISTTPPLRSGVKINDPSQANVDDLFLLNAVGFDFNLSLLPSLELAVDNYTYGLKWQLLNHRQPLGNIIASVLAAYGSKTQETDSNGAESKTKVTTSRAGLSIGYGMRYLSPYVSYIYEEHKADTDVTNAALAYSYNDSGRHNNYSFGLTTMGKGLNFAVEYNYIEIDWETAAKAYQNDVGVRLGVEW